MQQDAHEFLNYLLNTIADILQEERKQEKQNGRLPNGGLDGEGGGGGGAPDPTWVHEIFQGTLTNETRCLTCETVSVRLLSRGECAVAAVLRVWQLGERCAPTFRSRVWAEC